MEEKTEEKIKLKQTSKSENVLCQEKIIKIKNHPKQVLVLLLLEIVIICLLANNHSLKSRIAELEILNDNLVSENSSLSSNLEGGYSDSSIESEKNNSFNQAKEDNSQLEAEIATLNVKLNEALDENADLKEQDNSALQKELTRVKRELESLSAKEKQQTEIYTKMLDFVNSDYLGTDEYHSDQYIILTDGKEKEITITARSTKKYTTTVEGDNYGVLTEWISPFENYQAKLRIIPKNEGVTKFHFSNSFNSDNFDVLVVYLKTER